MMRTFPPVVLDVCSLDRQHVEGIENTRLEVLGLQVLAYTIELLYILLMAAPTRPENLVHLAALGVLVDVP